MRGFRFLSQLLTLIVLSIAFGAFQRALAQTPTAPDNSDRREDAAPKEDSSPTSNAPPQAVSETSGKPTPLLLGPGDEIEVSVYGAPDLSGHTRVNENGSISIPLIGYVRVAGLSTSEAEGAIEAQLRQ